MDMHVLYTDNINKINTTVRQVSCLDFFLEMLEKLVVGVTALSPVFHQSLCEQVATPTVLSAT